ncbi:CoA pyrophosphatase [Albirhodobacter sp. R86504]|uniref:CoA pyrophosphatase n=1 Tax=Albirhodobacter sp. R86504 TaxID=3093848 RepID=UPI0036708192
MTDPLAPILQALARSGRPSSDYDLNPDIVLPPGRPLREAGVLAAFRDGPAGAELMLTKRSSHLRHHPGQIAFPGGKVDPTDANPTAAALREAQEEVGLDPSSVTVLGTFDPHETVTGFTVTPVFARIHGPFTPRAEIGEVDEIFFVPLSHIANPTNFRVEGRVWRGTTRSFYTVPYGPYYIWGATARILRALADRIAG